ncbi:MAG: hypothetical protein JNK11_09710 [Alphaproteobacteria bacterium]|nr:hypothetical protein [Alphaproteobacteria bacterium]
METLLEILGEANVWAFLFTTFVMFGYCAWLTGQAVANGWRPTWHVAAYAFLLALGNRFASWALFGGELGSLTGLLVAIAAAFAIATFSHRATRARKMVTQYPWLYARHGLFGWREKASG